MSEQNKSAADNWKSLFGGESNGEESNNSSNGKSGSTENKESQEAGKSWAEMFGTDKLVDKTEEAVVEVNKETTNQSETANTEESYEAGKSWADMFGTDQMEDAKAFLTPEETQEDLNAGLQKTKRNIFQKLTRAVAGKSTVDEEVLDDIEEALISGDVSLDTTIKIINRLEARVAADKFFSSKELNKILKNEIVNLLSENNTPDYDGYTIPEGTRPHVVMVVGVNGVGKTTTIAKMAYHFKARGHSVVLGAADTFRAAAVDQLTMWANRIGVDIVSKGMEADPSSVAFDTLASAKAKNADLVLIDTAGRLHNKKGLMEELAKIKRVMAKQIPDAPHEVMLVLDGSTGQNALEQAKQFSEFTTVTSLAITKLDGSAKGGVIIGIADQMQIPIRYIGVGEKAEHLQVFDKMAFVNTLFD